MKRLFLILGLGVLLLGAWLVINIFRGLLVMM